MARRTLTFETYTDDDDLEPIEVKVGPKGKEEVFLANPMVPGVDILDLVAGLGSESAAENAQAVRKILTMAIIEEDQELFWEFVGEKKNFVGVTTLDNIAMGLAEEYMGGIPTAPEQSSSTGSAPNGSGPKAKSSKKAATSAA